MFLCTVRMHIISFSHCSRSMRVPLTRERAGYTASEQAVMRYSLLAKVIYLHDPKSVNPACPFLGPLASKIIFGQRWRTKPNVAKDIENTLDKNHFDKCLCSNPTCLDYYCCPRIAIRRRPPLQVHSGNPPNNWRVPSCSRRALN
jgi:hypothetical protein